MENKLNKNIEVEIKKYIRKLSHDEINLLYSGLKEKFIKSNGK